MRVAIISLLSPCLLITAQPVSAQIGNDGLNCAIDQVSPSHASDILIDYLRRSSASETSAGSRERLSSLVYDCAQKLNLNQSAERQFFQYSLSMVLRNEARRRMIAIGLDIESLDKELDIGPGRTNPISRNFTSDNWQAVEDALRAVSANQSLHGKALQLLSTYTVASKSGYEALASLR